MLIRTKLTLSLLSLVFVPLLVIAVLTYVQARESLKETRLASLISIAELKVKLIQQTHQQKRLDLEAFQYLFNVRRHLPVLAAHLGEPAGDAARAARRHLDAQLRQFAAQRGIVDVQLVDLHGRVIYALQPFRPGLPYREPLPGRRLAEEGRREPVLSEYFAVDHGVRPHFAMVGAAPLAGLDGEPIGVVLAEFDMAPFFDAIQDVTGLGRTGETLLGRKQGDVVVFLNPLRHDRDAAFRRQVRLGSPVAQPVQRATRENGNGIAADYRGVEVVAVWRHIPEFGLAMVAKMDADEAFADVDRLRDFVFAISLLTLLTGLLVALGLARHLGRPIHRLQQAAEAIGQGNLDYRIAQYGHDELGQLARRFDLMMDALRTLTASRNDLEREVAERLRAEEALRFHLDELSRLNAELDEFSYIASHDLQEPLRKILMFGEWLQKDAGEHLPETAAQDLEYIADATRRMQRLIHDLLAFSRLGRQALQRECFPLDRVVEEALADLAPRIVERNARIERDPLPEVNADPRLLLQLYQNLIGNALKYTRETPLIRLTAEKRDGEWVFGVRDNGIGIAPQNAEQIFQPFKRLHGSGVYDGTGIGLAICRKVVDFHDGRLWVESEEGAGAHFRFTLGKG